MLNFAAGVIIVASLAFHVATHLDAAGWVAKGALRDTVVIEGHLVEWEWLHVGATAAMFDPRLREAQPISTQDAFRVIPGYLVGALRGPLGGSYGAALAATLLIWAAAAVSIAYVARSTGCTWSPLAGIAGATLVAHGAGYVAFLGNVDAHQFGYAAAAMWAAAWVGLDPAGLAHPTRQGSLRAAAVGILLCVAGYTMEIAFPLLLSAYLLFAAAALGGLPWRTAIARGAVMSVAFAVPFFTFQALMRLWLGERLVAMNEPLAQLGSSLTALASGDLALWVASRVTALVHTWHAAFPPPITLLTLVGLIVVPRQWALWALLIALPLVAGAAVTKLLVRTLYLVHAPVYVLAACGAAWLSDLVGRFAPRLRLLALIAILGTTVFAANADLWGDYWRPVQWWLVQ